MVHPLAQTVARVVGVCIVNLIVGLLLLYAASGGGLLSGWRDDEEAAAHEAEIEAQRVDPASIEDRLGDVGGLRAVKADIETQVLLPLRHPRLFFTSAHRIRPPRGVLLHGPPGTGKTMLARAIAGEAQVPFFALTLATLESKWHGESVKLLEAAFRLARRVQPCILFFDEIDGMIRRRSGLDDSHVYAFKTQFLMHMDGVRKRDDEAIVVIACTNCPAALDPAVRRRLPQQYEIGLPTREELRQILALQVLPQDRLPEEDIEDVMACVSGGRSGSDMAELARAASAIKLRGALASRHMRRMLELPTATPRDLQRWVGRAEKKHYHAALREKGWWRPRGASNGSQ